MFERFKRTWKHRWLGKSTSHHTITPDLLNRLGQRVTASEQWHSGQIRICIEAGLPLSYLWRAASMRQITRQRALAMFSRLHVWDTAHNNGVLIYLLLAERSIEIVADRGLNDLVEAPLWHAILHRMRGAFQQNRFEDGLTLALEEVSTLLAQHFPVKKEERNPNELPDLPVLQ